MKSKKISNMSKLQNLACPRVDEGENNGKLTLKELRKCVGFADVPDSEGKEIIESLYKLSLIAFNYKVTK